MCTKIILPEESYAIRGAVYEVYRILGSGFLEEVYQNALEEEMNLRGIPFQAKPRLHIMYKGRDCGDYYSPDFICYDKIVVEIKAVERPHPRHDAQVMNYLKATGLSLGLLVNFGAYPRATVSRIVLSQGKEQAGTEEEVETGLPLFAHLK